MKIQPIMDDQFAKYYSDLTTTSPDHVKFVDTEYSSDDLVEEICHPAAKTVNVLIPVAKRSSGSDKSNSSSTDFEISTANKIYTKELVSSNKVNKTRIENLSSYGENTFDQDMRECHMLEKVNRLKSEGNKAATTKASSNKGGVRFDTITIQEYSVQPGVNPGGSKGCPLTIDWNPISTETLDLDVFERVRCEHRRVSEQLKMVSAHRQHLLRGMGYTQRNIMEGTKAANQARRARFSTIARLKSTDSQEKIEELERKFQNIVTFGIKKRKEQKYLAPYLDEKNNKNSSGLPKLQLPGKSIFSSAPKISAEEAF